MKRSTFTGEASATALSLLTWNILREGTSPLASGWTKRCQSFQRIFEGRGFDILCFQEVMPGQLDFFQTLFPRHDFYGLGREDGKSGGEHCPIFYDRERFGLRNCGTFWLSPTPEVPSTGWGEAFPRLCGWVELEDRFTGRIFKVSNLHLQLHPFAQSKAADLLAGQLGRHGLPQLVAGDFNCPARWPGVRRLLAAGLTRVPDGNRATFHLRGLPLRTLDHILTSSDWHVEETGLLNQRGDRVFPSDHFGLSARLTLP
jgi:endonuclease/exonuclease/phosphatase family metal-dependent hydrolase